MCMNYSSFMLCISKFVTIPHIYSETFEFNGKAIHYYSLQETLLRLVYVVTMYGTERLLGGFWFLKALFWGSIIFYVTRKLLSYTYYGVLMLLVTCLATSFFHLSIPFLKIGSLDLFAAFFIMTGHIFRRTTIGSQNLAENLISKWWLMIVFVIIIGIGSVYWPTSMLQYKWYHVIPYSITAIMGTIVLFSIGNWINHWNMSSNQVLTSGFFSKIRTFLVYTGGYTFNVLAWHFLSFKIVNFIIIALYGLNVDRLGDFPGMSEYAHQGWWVLYLIAGVAIPISGTYIYHSLISKKQ